jgi:hypothetical protein
LKHICPNYEPPEEDEDGMGTFINAGIMTDTDTLSSILQQQNIKKEEPKKEEEPKKKPFWKKALATIAGLTLAGVAGAAISQYLEDDPVPYDIQAVPYRPE